MAETFTPGPWRVYDDTDTPNQRCEVVAMGKTICHIYRSVATEDPHNARLIAAAPDLLDALIALVERGTDSPEHLAAERAIAKASGAAP